VVRVGLELGCRAACASVGGCFGLCVAGVELPQHYTTFELDALYEQLAVALVGHDDPAGTPLHAEKRRRGGFAALPRLTHETAVWGNVIWPNQDAAAAEHRTRISWFGESSSLLTEEARRATERGVI
jgi:hypothetical protein